MIELRDIAEEIRRRGGEHSSEQRLLQDEIAPQAVAVIFGVAAGTPLFHSIILHRENGAPIQFEDRWVNPEVVPDYMNQNFERMTPGEYLWTVVPSPHVEHVLEARMPLPPVRKALEMRDGEPCLLLHRRSLVDNKTIARGWFWHPGSRYRMGTQFDAKR